MARYIYKHRRGSAEQWATANTDVPLEGEIVIELDNENSLHKLKIGDGIHTYSELAYLQAGDEIVTQVLNKALPRVITVPLDVDKWEQITDEDDPRCGHYQQAVTINGITPYSRLDLHPEASMLAEFQNLNLIFVTENNNSIITVYSIGDMPLKDYDVQATIVETEVVTECEKIVGTPVGTLYTHPSTHPVDMITGLEDRFYTEEEIDEKEENINNEIQALKESLTSDLPEVTAADNGKFLVVENGVWTAKEIALADDMEV